MLDSNGKAPDGIFSEYHYLCLFVAQIGFGFCPQDLQQVSDRHPYPQGHSVSMGNYEGCAAVEARNDGSLDFAWEDFEGAFCPINVITVDYATGQKGGSSLKFDVARSNLPRGGAYWVQDIWDNTLNKAVAWLYPAGMAPKAGLCVPSGCTYFDVTNNYKELYSEQYLGVDMLPCATKASQAEKRLTLTSQYAYM